MIAEAQRIGVVRAGRGTTHIDGGGKLATQLFCLNTRFARSAYVRLCVKSEPSVTSGQEVHSTAVWLPVG